MSLSLDFLVCKSEAKGGAALPTTRVAGRSLGLCEPQYHHEETSVSDPRLCPPHRPCMEHEEQWTRRCSVTRTLLVWATVRYQNWDKPAGHKANGPRVGWMRLLRPRGLCATASPSVMWDQRWLTVPSNSGCAWINGFLAQRAPRPGGEQGRNPGTHESQPVLVSFMISKVSLLDAFLA